MRGRRRDRKREIETGGEAERISSFIFGPPDGGLRSPFCGPTISNKKTEKNL